ncbi:hypothetical protein [Hominibacterium faecale]|uniref:hypothetical protein n=1 Tax=Hominibacterium faecale TaxID=2839743 RepID=UPI0022B2A134|nr:hypothetical protein [Hominibacterium faecale]
MAEIEATLNSHYRTIRQKEKVNIERLFVLAEAIGSRVAYLFAQKEDRAAMQVIQPWDMYPELFAEEQQMAEKMKQELELQEYIEARKQQAAAYSRKRQEVEPDEY